VDVVSELRSSGLFGKNEKWGFAVEVEPGHNYIINDIQSLDAFFAAVDAKGVDKHIGLNLDIAHYILCGIPKNRVEPHRHRIMHGHISDHPEMHTRDHPPGDWRRSDMYHSLEAQYLGLLASAVTDSDRALPHSSSLSLELEGCSQLSWCDNGIAAIRRLVDISQHSKSAEQTPAV
jgi:hypothetical protein